MKKYKFLIAIEAIIIVSLTIIICLTSFVLPESVRKHTLKYEQTTPDNKYKVSIIQVGSPDFFGDARYNVRVTTNNEEVNYPVNEFTVWVSDDGGIGEFKTDLTEEKFTVIFSGSEQQPYTITVPLGE